LSKVISFGTCASVTAQPKLDKVKFASTTSTSTSSFQVSSVIVILELQAFNFLNSRSTQVFCLNTQTQAVQTLEAVLVSQPQAVGKFQTCTIFLLLASALSSIIIISQITGVHFSVITDISAATLSWIAFVSVVPKLKLSIVSNAFCTSVSAALRLLLKFVISVSVFNAELSINSKAVSQALACNILLACHT
jgi:hypothetical protein